MVLHRPSELASANRALVCKQRAGEPTGCTILPDFEVKKEMSVQYENHIQIRMSRGVLAIRIWRGCTGSTASDGRPSFHSARCICCHRGNRSRCERALVRIESWPSFAEARKIAEGSCRNCCLGRSQPIC